jgi:hypothetical protein
LKESSKELLIVVARGGFAAWRRKWFSAGGTRKLRGGLNGSCVFRWLLWRAGLGTRAIALLNADLGRQDGPVHDESVLIWLTGRASTCAEAAMIGQRR